MMMSQVLKIEAETSKFFGPEIRIHYFNVRQRLGT